MTFDPTKPVVCRNGCKAEILVTNLSGYWSILAIITDTNGKRNARVYRQAPDCAYSASRDGYDLINVHEKVTRWVWRYKDARGSNECFGWTANEPDYREKSQMDTYYPIEIEVGRKE